MRNSPGFTLLETLIVVLLISILTAITAPRLLESIDRGRQSSTMADLRLLGTALERYAVDHQRYPVVDGMAALGPELAPKYVKKVPLRDGWKNPLIYQVDEEGESYVLRSPGKDGETQDDEFAELTHDFDADIVFSDGVFLQRPGGEQE